MSLKDATVCLEQARDHERRGRYQAALKLYEKGIRLLMDCKSVASDPSSIRAHISDFLERAENCKKRAIAVRLSSDKACASQAIVKGSLSRSSAAKRISRDADLNASNAGPRVQPHTRRKSCGADESLRSVIEDEIIHMRSGISMNDIVGLDQVFINSANIAALYISLFNFSADQKGHLRSGCSASTSAGIVSGLEETF
uniref:MIT domain-containing protein n=1 Tax=Spongospora subterranea TaxID=70186 RepID=A0A0H5QIX5_9EUKA|eukprot:CRZ01948.1 hypothetical protein [Spongospora subterranea]